MRPVSYTHLDVYKRQPKGVRLETPEEIATEARRIYVQAGLTHAMPPANVSFIEPEERAKIVAWYRAATEDGTGLGG